MKADSNSHSSTRHHRGHRRDAIDLEPDPSNPFCYCKPKRHRCFAWAAMCVFLPRTQRRGRSNLNSNEKIHHHLSGMFFFSTNKKKKHSAFFVVYTGPNCTRSHRFAETTWYKFVVGPNNDINVHSAITYVKSSAAREGMPDAKWQTSRVTNDKSKRHTSYTPASSASCEHANISATRDWLTAASFERFAFVPGVVYSYRCFFLFLRHQQ